jgi:hypothetical protein
MMIYAAPSHSARRSHGRRSPELDDGDDDDDDDDDNY